jgi:hypothetical protein
VPASPLSAPSRGAPLLQRRGARAELHGTSDPFRRCTGTRRGGTRHLEEAGDLHDLLCSRALLGALASFSSHESRQGAGAPEAGVHSRDAPRGLGRRWEQGGDSDELPATTLWRRRGEARPPASLTFDDNEQVGSLLFVGLCGGGRGGGGDPVVVGSRRSGAAGQRRARGGVEDPARVFLFIGLSLLRPSYAPPRGVPWRRRRRQAELHGEAATATVSTGAANLPTLLSACVREGG